MQQNPKNDDRERQYGPAHTEVIREGHVFFSQTRRSSPPSQDNEIAASG